MVRLARRRNNYISYVMHRAGDLRNSFNRHGISMYRDLPYDLNTVVGIGHEEQTANRPFTLPLNVWILQRVSNAWFVREYNWVRKEHVLWRSRLAKAVFGNTAYITASGIA